MFPVDDPVDDCAMEVSAEVFDSGTNGSLSNTDPNPPPYFANPIGFEQSQWSQAAANQQMVNMNGWNCQVPETFYVENVNVVNPSEIYQPTLKESIDLGTKNIKPSPSLFQMAKTFCGNIMKKHKPNIELGLDEITNQMALLRFTA